MARLNDRQKFQPIRKGNDETFPQFQARLELLLRCCLALAGKHETFEDFLLYEQLLAHATPGLAAFIREQNPSSVVEAAASTESYVNAQRAFQTDHTVKPHQAPAPSPHILSNGAAARPCIKHCFNCRGLHLKCNCPRLNKREEQKGGVKLAALSVGHSVITP